MSELWESARVVLGLASLSIGSVLVLIGAIGLVRLRDVYQRMHGAGIVDTGGAGLILLGLLLLAETQASIVRLILIGVILVFTAPTATHAIARAARFANVKPQLKDDA